MGKGVEGCGGVGIAGRCVWIVGGLWMRGDYVRKAAQEGWVLCCPTAHSPPHTAWTVPPGPQPSPPQWTEMRSLPQEPSPAAWPTAHWSSISH